MIEVSGDLKLNPDGKRVVSLPLKVQGELLYDERVLNFEASGGLRRDVRFYRQADASIRVGDHSQKTRLDDNHSLAVANLDDDGQVLFSPQGPLTLDELDLIDVQGSSTLLFRLLPEDEVAIGDSWPQGKTTLAALLSLEAVTFSDVQSTLRQVEGKLALIEMEGQVSGAVRGIATDIELEGKYNFDLRQQRITWFALSLKEDRGIGHAEPGFEVLARVRTAIAPSRLCPELSDQAIAGVPLETQAGGTLLRFPASHGGFQFLHDRQWRVMTDRHDVAILRRIDKGEMIAQCNASKLVNLKEGQRVQLAAFKADIRRALSDEFGRFVETSESETSQGLHVLRAVASGVASEIPVQWNYYHLSDNEGRQVAVVFTMDARRAEQFAASDQTIISTLEFMEISESAGDDSPPPTGNATARRTSSPKSQNQRAR